MIMIVQFFLSLSLLIILHEGGHFFAAKWFNTRVEKFYLFFDPWFSLVKKKIGGTEYGIGWLPLGGYVKISGMIDESMDKEQMKGPAQPWEFRSKPAWQRLIIMLGGVIVNFVLGFFIFAMMLWQWGESYIPSENVRDGIFVLEEGQKLGLEMGDQILKVGDYPFSKFDDGEIISNVIINDASTITVLRDGKTIDIPVDPENAKRFARSDFKGKKLFDVPFPFVIAKSNPGSPAEKAGLKADDRIVSVNGVKTEQNTIFLQEITKYKNEKVELGVIRDNKRMDVELTTKESGTIGVLYKPETEFYDEAFVEYGFFESFPAGVKKGMDVLTDQIKAFGKIFSGKIEVTESLGGPIMIATMFPGEWNAQIFWRMTAILSLILAFMNLLPIPALDGGHVMFLLWEMTTGKKPSDKFMEITTMIGFFILIAFMIFVFGNDIRRFFFS